MTLKACRPGRYSPLARALTLASSLPAAALAQTATEPVKDAETLSPVVVTATGLESPLSLTAASVTIISSQEIEERQIHTLESALRTTPGVTVAGRGLGSGPAGLFIRGAKTEQSRVVLNGRPISANLANSFNIETIPLDNLERVEILRGPASWLYGGSALGGVVNLISRDPRTLENPVTTVWGEGGSYDTWRSGFETEGASGPVFWSFGAQYYTTNGHRINSDWEETSAAGRIGWQVSDEFLIDLDFRYADAEAGVPGAATGWGANDPNNLLITETFSISPRFVWTPSDSTTHTLIWQTSRFRQAARNFDYFGGNNRVQVNQEYLDYRLDHVVSEQLTLSAGAQAVWREYWRYNDDAGSTDILEHEDSVAAFAGFDWKLTDNLLFQGGFRYEETSDFGGEPSGRAGLVWHTEDGWKAHAAYGSAFSPPTPQDRQPALYGNPDIVRPERGHGVELGLEKTWQDPKLTVSATFFHTEVDNLIEYDPTRWAIERIDEARLQGFETGLVWNQGGDLEFGVNYTYLDAKNLTDNTALVRRPRHTVNASLYWRPTEALTFGAEALFVMDREDGFGAAQANFEDYSVVRFTGRWKLTENLEIYGRLENALNEDYEEVQGYPAVGTAAFGGIRVQF